MPDIQIQLTSKQDRALRRIAAREGKSIAELIQTCLENMLRTGDITDKEMLRQRALAAAGRLYGPEDLAKRHDDYSGAAFGDYVIG
jgi:hypothetical protein